jgi:hypothetical protein
MGEALEQRQIQLAASRRRAGYRAAQSLTPKSLKMVASIIDAISTHQDQWTRRFKGDKPS